MNSTMSSWGANRERRGTLSASLLWPTRCPPTLARTSWAGSEGQVGHTARVNLHQHQGLCSALDAHDHYGGLLTHFTEELGFEPGVRGLGAQGPYPLTRPFHVGVGVFLGKGLGAHWEMGLTSGPTARMTKAGRPQLPLPHPPQPPEPCRETCGWLEHRSRGRREAFTAPDCGPGSP